MDHPGVTYHIDDKDLGPFMLRVGGTSTFISFIDDYDGFVDTVAGWNNKKALMFSTLEAALNAADQVWTIEGFRTSIEPRA